MEMEGYACLKCNRLPVAPSTRYHAGEWMVSPLFFAHLYVKTSPLPLILLIFEADVGNLQRFDKRLQTLTNFFPCGKAESWEGA
jgi:hypothetical protein